MMTSLEKQKSKIKIQILHPLRGKKLLVLDLDYTLFDCKSPASHISLLARPGLHEFLTAMYQEYELVIWSQTSWRYLEAKITELGMLTHDEYKISFGKRFGFFNFASWVPSSIFFFLI